MTIQNSKGRRAVFIADGGENIGGGHIMRCLTLADGLTANGWCCQFAVHGPDQEFHQRVLPDRCHLVPLDVANGDLVIVDHYGLDQGFEKSLRDSFDKIFVIDDLANRDHDCDLLLDQTYKRSRADYENRVPETATVLVGSGYALLRPAFREQRGKIIPRSFPDGRAFKVLISFGLHDETGITVAVLQALLDTVDPEKFEFTVLFAGAGDNRQPLEQMLSRYDPCPVTVLDYVDDMASLMAKNDVMIGAFGTTSWERCCLGLPSVALVIADNQQSIADGLSEKGAALFPGRWPDAGADAVVDAVLDLLSDPDAYLKMSKIASSTVDGKGIGRVITAIENLFSE